ncbi:MAG: hypothetical protein ACTSO9_12125 [Candidatus Helarchaeota archaeon]
MPYEMRIFAKDKTKIIYFGENEMGWEDTYNSAALVIDDEPDQFEENGVLIGKIETYLPYEEVIRIMIEDAGLMGPKEEAALKDPSPQSEVLPDD